MLKLLASKLATFLIVIFHGICIFTIRCIFNLYSTTASLSCRNPRLIGIVELFLERPQSSNADFCSDLGKCIFIVYLKYLNSPSIQHLQYKVLSKTLSKHFLCHTSWELNLRTFQVVHFKGRAYLNWLKVC